MRHHINRMQEIKYNSTCSWIDADIGTCNHVSIPGKSYCKAHYDRMYLTMPPEMAQYIIDKEVKSILGDID